MPAHEYMVKGQCYSLECEFHTKWAFTQPVWCEFGGFSRYNFYSVVRYIIINCNISLVGIGHIFLFIVSSSPIISDQVFSAVGVGATTIFEVQCCNSIADNWL